MPTTTVFKRYELKYLLTKAQSELLHSLLGAYMQLDEYGRYLIKNIYFDTPNYQLIRRSIEKPFYKEKLRVRRYGENADTAYIEMKKKLDGVVYKRRLKVHADVTKHLLSDTIKSQENSQIANEISYFLKHYQQLQPAVLLNYEREAFAGEQYPDLRLTFDYNIKMKNMMAQEEGFHRVVSDEFVLLEVKTHLGLPPWLLEFFRENRIYKTSFSKYGTAYQKFILSELDGGTQYAG